jgi:hypothetical protein
LALIVIACGATPSATRTPSTPSPTVDAVDAGYITKAEVGMAWPFTIPSGTLRCYDDALTGRQYVTFDNGDGIEYALNGSARDFGFPELDETILIDFPNPNTTTLVLPLITRALELCD